MTDSVQPKPRKQVLTPPAKLREEAVLKKQSVFDAQERKLIIERQPNTSLSVVKRDGGGVVPLPLQGMYTSEQAAERAISEYIERKIHA